MKASFTIISIALIAAAASTQACSCKFQTPCQALNESQHLAKVYVYDNKSTEADVQDSQNYSFIFNATYALNHSSGPNKTHHSASNVNGTMFIGYVHRVYKSKGGLLIARKNVTFSTPPVGAACGKTFVGGKYYLIDFQSDNNTALSTTSCGLTELYYSIEPELASWLANGATCPL